MAELEKPLVIVPTYNEVENVETLTARILNSVPTIHVLFVDDNSQDGTREKIRLLIHKYPGQIFTLERPGKLGLGTAYIAGFRWALARDYTSVTEMDADLSHEPERLSQMLSILQKYDVVIGSRYIPGGGTKNWGFIRQLISRFGGLYGRFILGLDIQDLTGGYNTWKRSTLEKMDLNAIKSSGYAFQIELKYRAHCLGEKIVELPIMFEDRRAGHSKMSIWIVIEAMIRVWKIRLSTRKKI